jgi:hypothetical protein
MWWLIVYTYIYSTSSQSTATAPRRRHDVRCHQRVPELIPDSLSFLCVPLVRRAVDFTESPYDGDEKINDLTPIVIVLPGLTGGVYCVFVILTSSDPR